jgi:predicted oxidoreductase (fatty acid repression mutant protein)
MFTIKQAAEKLKVSRQSIYNKIDSQQMKAFVINGQKGKLIKEEGLEVLANLINSPSDSKKDSTSDSKQEESLTSVLQVKDDYIRSLKEQLSDYKEQLSKKDEQIETLSRLTENTQILLKVEQEKLLALENQDQKRKRSFLNRLFGK